MNQTWVSGKLWGKSSPGRGTHRGKGPGAGAKWCFSRANCRPWKGSGWGAGEIIRLAPEALRAGCPREALGLAGKKSREDTCSGQTGRECHVAKTAGHCGLLGAEQPGQGPGPLCRWRRVVEASSTERQSADCAGRSSKFEVTQGLGSGPQPAGQTGPLLAWS